VDFDQSSLDKFSDATGDLVVQFAFDDVTDPLARGVYYPN
jgi:hypothetical protein